MSAFDESVARMAINLEAVDGTVIVIAVCDDPELWREAVAALRRRTLGRVDLREFWYDVDHLSLLEGAAIEAKSTPATARVAVAAGGLPQLPRDKRSEAIHLLNRQRNRLGQAESAVVLWIDKATLSDIATMAADFYSWRSATVFIEPLPGWKSRASARRAYLNAVVRENELVSIQGLAPTRGGQVVQMRMDEIVVPLRARRKPSRAPTSEGDSGRDVAEPGPLEVPLSVLKNERRAIILGDPGAGKTTALRHLAHWVALQSLAEPARAILPVYLRANELVGHLRTRPGANLVDILSAALGDRRLPVSEQLVTEAVRDGQLTLLVDGIDEIVDRSQRTLVLEAIRHFSSASPVCQIVITSRLVGYNQGDVGGEFSTFVIAPFDDDEIDLFVDRWYQALGRAEDGVGLKAAIAANPSIRRLASNPLLLTVIALVHFRRARLPSQRVLLYRVASETLVDQWMTFRRVTPEGWDAKEVSQLLLPAVAWHMHTSASTGLLGEEELDAVVVETLRHHAGWLDERELWARAAQFRRSASEFSGIFLERGVDDGGRRLYGFLHLTFQEYFSALRLVDSWERDGPEPLRARLHDSRWVEVVLLAAGHLGEFSRSMATRFVETILQAASPCEPVLHRDLLLSARCMADDVPVDARLRHRIVDQLVALLLGADTLPTLRASVRHALAGCKGAVAEGDIVRTLGPLLESPDSQSALRASWTVAAASTGEARSKAVHRLLAMLTANEEFVRVDAAFAISEVCAAHDQTVVAALLDALSDPSATVARAAATALGSLAGSITPAVIDRLLALVSEGDDAAPAALAALGGASATPNVVGRVSEMLRKPHLRSNAQSVLLGLGPAAATPQSLDALQELMLSDDSSGQEAALEIVGRIGPAASRPDIVELVAGALSDEDHNVRASAVIAACALGRAAGPELIKTVVRLLWDPVPIVRGVAARSAPRAGGVEVLSDQIGVRMVELLQDEKWYVRASAADGMDAMSQPLLARAAEPLLDLLWDPHESVRIWASRAVRRLGPAAATPRILDRLVELLRQPENRFWSVPRALTQLSSSMVPSERARISEKVLAIITDPASPEANRDDAFRALAGIVGEGIGDTG